MIKLPIDQKFQILNENLDRLCNPPSVSLQRAMVEQKNTQFISPEIILYGEPSNKITIKEEPIHTIMISWHSCHEDIYIGDIQNGITCTFTPKGNATKLTISKRSVFLNGELVEFTSKKKEPFTKGQEVILTGKALEKYFHDNPHKTIPPQGKVEQITHMDDGTFLIVFRDKTDWQMQYDSSGLTLISNLPFKVGDFVRLTKKYMNGEDNPLLYYIVRKGTNAIFASKHTGKPLLVDSSRTEYEVEQIQKQAGHEHEAISTFEYERKFGQRKAVPKQRIYKFKIGEKVTEKHPLGNIEGTISGYSASFNYYTMVDEIGTEHIVHEKTLMVRC